MNEIHSEGMDLNLLRVFHSVYIESSVTAAAHRLGLTQSAVSHCLRKLRELFGDELFVRSGTGMVPTPRAQSLFDPVNEIMETLSERIFVEASFDAATAHRAFSLVMGDMAEMVILPALMRHLRQHAPHCTVRSRILDNEAMLDGLRSDEAELALGNIPEATDSFYSQTLFVHDYAVLTSRDHPRIKAALEWGDYSREQHVVVASGLDVNLQVNMLVPRGIRRKVVLTIGAFLSVPSIIRGTDLIATVPSRLAEELSPTAELRVWPLPEPAPPFAIQSVWHARWHKDPAHRWLRQELFQLFKGYPVLPLPSQ